MRDCFLYLARYPEDHVINSWELKCLWVAEEFISEVEGVLMEDVAEDYLIHLINRNLIQVGSLAWDGKVMSCRVHDLVRDLGIKKAKEHKFLVSFDSSKHHQDPIHLLGQPRHVIYKGIGEYLKLVERFDTSNLSSFAVECFGTIDLKEMKLMYTKFKNLKVLDMRTVYSEIPEEMGDLVLLKYLGLMGGKKYSIKPTKIPPSIGKLKKLQTLAGAELRFYTVPKEICELHELRYLDIRISGRLNIGSQQTKLQTILSIEYKEWIKIDAVNLPNLHYLSLNEEEDGDGYSLESIANLTSLQTLGLYLSSFGIPTIKPLSSCNRLKTVLLYRTLKDPSLLCLLPDSVTELRLLYCGFTEDPMPSLGSLSNLTFLQLVGVYRGNKMVCRQNAFPSLQILSLQLLNDLEELEVEDGAFPSLKKFQASYCIKLKKIPVQLEQLTIKI
nr:disease resistance RPP13-like protein [Anethum foeniculum]